MPPGGTTPKYQTLYAELRERLRGGELPVGSKLPTDQELMESRQVSRNTVRKAVSLLVEDGLVDRLQGSGTWVIGQSPPAKGRVAFIADGAFDTSSKHTVFGRIEEAIYRRLRASSGLELIPMPLCRDRDTKKFRRDFVADSLRAGLVGAFLFPAGMSERPGGGGLDEDERLLDMLAKERVPAVLLDRDTTEVEGARFGHDMVELDNRRAGLEVGRHLREVGACRVLFISYADEPRSVRERFEGVRDAFGDAAEVTQCKPAGITDQSLAEALSDARPDAVVAKDDNVAAQVMRCLYRRGRSIPGEVLVAGFDDSPMAAQLMVPLTTYAQPVPYIAGTAVELLEARIHDPQTPIRKVTLAGRLVVRESTLDRGETQGAPSSIPPG